MGMTAKLFSWPAEVPFTWLEHGHSMCRKVSKNKKKEKKQKENQKKGEIVDEA